MSERHIEKIDHCEACGRKDTQLFIWRVGEIRVVCGQHFFQLVQGLTADQKIVHHSEEGKWLKQN